jgi:hypothetical protein
MGIKPDGTYKMTKGPVILEGQEDRQQERQIMDGIAQQVFIGAEFHTVKGIDIIVQGYGIDFPVENPINNSSPTEKNKSQED